MLAHDDVTARSLLKDCLMVIAALVVPFIPIIIDWAANALSVRDHPDNNLEPESNQEILSTDDGSTIRATDAPETQSSFPGDQDQDQDGHRQVVKRTKAPTELSTSPSSETSSQETSDPPIWSREPSQSDTNTSFAPTIEAQQEHELDALGNFLTTEGPWNPTHPSNGVTYQEPLPKVLADLNNAMQSDHWAKRHQGRYTNVRVLMASWENASPNMTLEVNRLAYCFEKAYHFQVDHVRIPNNENASLETWKAVIDFSMLKNKSSSADFSRTLLIFYYAGHGQRNSTGMHRWTPEPQDPDETSPVQVDPELPLAMFTTQSRMCGFDALILLDCCHPVTAKAADSHPSDSVCQLFAACGDGDARGAGDNSFTNLLIHALYTAADSGTRYSVTELHGILMKKCLEAQNKVKFHGADVAPVQDKERPGKPKVSWTVRRVPIHHFMSKSTDNLRQRSIVIEPLASGPETSGGSSDITMPPKLIGLDVMLSFHVDEDMEAAGPQVRAWLFDAPAAIHRIKVWKILPGHSSIIILQVPVDVWDSLRSSPAVTFLGFANADRLPPKPGQPRWMMPIMDASSHIDNTVPDRFPTARPLFMWRALNHGVVCEDGSYWAQNFLHITALNPNEPLLTPTEKQEYLKSGTRLPSVLSEVTHVSPGRRVKKRITWDGATTPSLERRHIAATTHDTRRKGDRDIQSNSGSSRPGTRYSSPARMSVRGSEPIGLRRDGSISGRSPHKRVRSIDCIVEMPNETQDAETPASGNPTGLPIDTQSTEARENLDSTEEETEEEKMEAMKEDPGEQLSTRPASCFVPGRVFKMLWTEPLDQKTQDSELQWRNRRPSTGMYVGGNSEGPNGEQRPFWVGFLRFIVVSKDTDCCVCVPISTYGGKGCTREEIRGQARAHGVIYQNGSEPETLPGEPELGVPPVKLILSDEEDDVEPIARESRVNYAKRIKIKYNVKVLFIGQLDQNGKQVMDKAIRECTSSCK